MEAVKAFFVNLYKKFINLSWVQWTIDYCKANVGMALIVGGAVLAILLVLLAILLRKRAKKKQEIRAIRKALNVSKRKAKKIYKQNKKLGVTLEDYLEAEKEIAAEKTAEEAAKVATANEVASAEPTVEPTPAEEPVVETVAEEPALVAEERATIEEPAEVPVEPVVEVPTPVEESAAVQEAAVANEEIEVVPVAVQEAEIVEPVPAEAPVAEEPAPVEEPAPAPVVEQPAEAPVEPAPVVEPVAEQPVEPAPAEEPAPTKKKKTTPDKKRTRAQDAEEVLAAVENDEIDEFPDHDDESETDRQAKYKGKWVICRVITDEEGHEEMFFFELRASNGEKLLSSEEYTTYQGALRGIETHKNNILKGNLKLTLSKKGDYIFKLLSGKNMLLCMGENYPTRARCESAMESAKRFAATAVLDENVQDIVIKVPKEEDSPLPPLAENVVGKWIISSMPNAEGDTVYIFELYANNGEKLLCSEEYTTYIGAVNGIQTHKKNIQQNNFRISLTKRGDYIYKLLNGNGQLLCLGEHYKTKRLCQRAVESVQRFALNSPVLTNDKK